MFGYVTILKDELKIKEYQIYQSCYCGLCKSLKERHGMIAPITLSYDMTFLALLLSGLYEDQFVEDKKVCMMHVGKKQEVRQNKWTEYAADMTILLAYHNLLDDWNDDKKVTSLMTAKLLERQYRKIEHLYKKQAIAIQEYMKKLNEYEKSGQMELDIVAGFTGELLGTIFAVKEDEWSQNLYQMGFYLGKFIYFMDAYEDLEQDQKHQTYNPFLELAKSNEYEQSVYGILNMMLAECAKQFEKMPIIEYANILRNIIYSGVWVKYAEIKLKKVTKGENKL